MNVLIKSVPSLCLASIAVAEPLLPDIIDFSLVTPERSVSTPDADRLLAGQPTQVANNFFSDSTEQFFAGRWESTPGRWKVRYTENEFCHILAGRVRIEGVQGATHEFSQGDSFVVPAGFEGTWEVLETTMKLYAIFVSTR
ncbi:MAG: cupin domain-containing protein [Steroidobacteraceae bacterium]